MKITLALAAAYAAMLFLLTGCGAAPVVPDAVSATGAPHPARRNSIAA